MLRVVSLLGKILIFPLKNRECIPVTVVLNKVVNFALLEEEIMNKRKRVATQKHRKKAQKVKAKKKLAQASR